MAAALGAFGLAILALIVSTLHQRREHAASRSLAAALRAAIGQLAEEVTLLREALVHNGAVRQPAIPPPPLHPPARRIESDALAGAPLERPTSSATRTAEAFRLRNTRTRDGLEKGSG